MVAYFFVYTLVPLNNIEPSSIVVRICFDKKLNIIKPIAVPRVAVFKKIHLTPKCTFMSTCSIHM
jgi:hypothetical protein